MEKSFLGYAGPSVKQNATYKQVVNYWKSNRKNITKLSKAMIDADESKYDNAKNALDAEAEKMEGRILITLPDGTVKYDSAKGEKNSWSNFKGKNINENHNSRPAIMSAQLSRNFFGAEIKYSTSTGRVEAYLAKAMRLKYGNNLGTVRISKKEE
tara:strand:- start:600 stop:1064 length:465 start_codon:yes stop_codon:yes gene_type:complete